MRTHKPRSITSSAPRAGASTVELAFVAPVMFVFVFGVIEIAFGYMVHHLIQDAARQGCRIAVGYGQSDTTVLAKVNSLLSAEHITGATTKILVNNVAGEVASAKSGDQITVQITVPASHVSLFPTSGFLKGQLTALCTLRHE
jgi:Flp pilus assembly protein TadG